jgi:pimeloyl-ACP methyl ester carboxylesterase
MKCRLLQLCLPDLKGSWLIRVFVIHRHLEEHPNATARTTMIKIIQGSEATIWAKREGDQNDPCIILIAGSNASHLMWPDEFCELLISNRFSVIRYDHRDTGKSSKFDFATHAYTLRDLSEDIIAVLNGFEVQQAHIVGLSLGGSLTQAVVLDHPNRFLTATVMLAAALDVDFVGNINRAYTGEPNPWGLPSPKRDVLDVLSLRGTPSNSEEEVLDRRVKEWIALSGDIAIIDPAEFRRWEVQAIAHAGTTKLPVNHGLALPIPLLRGRELARIRTPFLVIQGGQDPLNPPPHGRHIAELIPTASFLEIQKLGHSLPSSLHLKIVEAIVKHIAAANG